jgi:5-oxoprolinase (ATP-hydrolysing) subunit A
MRTIDINCDLGESFGNWKLGNDEQVLPEITTANVACGFHGGDPLTMLRTVELAKEHGVAVGAHPGFPDLLGFGRRVMKISRDDAFAYIVYQAGALQGALTVHGVTLHHVKPHGAMYAVLREDEQLASATAEAIAKLMPEPMAYFPAEAAAVFPKVARAGGVRVVGEIYPDLSYAPDGSLVLQRAKQVTNLEKARAQVKFWIQEGSVLAEDGTRVPVEAESICIHGDGPNALDVVQAVRTTIEECGCAVGAVEAGTPTGVAAPA